LTAGQQVAHWAGDEAKTWVPAAVQQFTRTTTNPNQTNTSPTDNNDITGTIANSVKSALPGNTLPERHSVYGDTMATGASATGVHTDIPGVMGNGRAETTDPAEQELGRLANLTPAAVVTPVQKNIKIMGASVKLTTEQFEEYQKYAGQTIVNDVRTQMQSGSWSQMTDKNKIAYVKDLEKNAKEQVRDALVQKSGWLNEDQLSKLRKSVNGQ
jgi:hypothetical protein